MRLLDSDTKKVQLRTGATKLRGRIIKMLLQASSVLRFGAQERLISSSLREISWAIGLGLGLGLKVGYVNHFVEAGRDA